MFLREVVALSRVMERQPPTEFVVGFFGSGHTDVIANDGERLTLPWLAIEHVDGGTEGVSVGARVERSADGIDPVRALGLLRGICTGVAVLHGEGIIHRDLKPDNVLITGPIDDETPKLADCGIARVDGLAATVAGMTPSYGGPEQMLSTQGVKNPLVGTWTDVHALAAVAWFILGGEDWCRSETDAAWHAGERRSLRTASRLHPGFVSDRESLRALDAVLARGAAARLPEGVWERPEASEYLWAAKKLHTGMWSGAERFATVDELTAELYPVLEQCAARWTARSTLENRAATAFRPTQLVRASGGDGDRATARELPPMESVVTATPGSAVFQPDGRVLMRFGDRLFYWIGDEPHRVSVPADHAGRVSASRWLVRGPGGGFALVGEAHVLLVRGGRFGPMPMPGRATGGEVGPVQAVLSDGRVFGVVTAETDDSNGGPELWRSTDGTSWEEPVVLPIGGDVRCVAYGPYGYLVVGSRRGTKARGLFLGFDNQPIVYVVGVNDRAPLVTCVCGAGREGWGAGEGFVLSFDRTTVREEPVDAVDVPVAMALDVVGTPWLVTRRRVLRRHAGSGTVAWKLYYERAEDRPALIGIGFTPSGARVLDELGGGVQLVPRDIDTWRRSHATVAQRA